MTAGLSIIVATYNERDNIKPLFEAIKKVAENLAIPIEVIVVDDNSPDKTAVEVLRLSSLYPFSTILLKRNRKLGLGTAYKAGIKACSMPYTAIMDADLSHDPAALVQMMMNISNNRVVVGSRYCKAGKTENWDNSRIITSRGANIIAKLAIFAKINQWCQCQDLTGSYRIYPSEVLREALSISMSKGFSIQVELIRLCLDLGLEIVEVPINFRDRMAGESKLSAKEYASFLKTCYQLAVV